MAGSVRVVSKRRGGVQAAPGEWIIDGDRKNPVLGNRHVLLNHCDADERERVIHDHLVLDLEPDIVSGGPIYRELQRVAEQVKSGRRVAFACWCAPMPCHCDRYVDVVEMLVDGRDVQAIYRAQINDRQMVPHPAEDQLDFGF